MSVDADLNHQYRHILIDQSGRHRGCFVSSLDPGLLEVLFLMYCRQSHKMKRVQAQFPNLLIGKGQVNQKYMGGLYDYERLLVCDVTPKERKKTLLKYTSYVSEVLKVALSSPALNSCSSNQTVKWYFSFLRSRVHDEQLPHIDFRWTQVLPPWSYPNKYIEPSPIENEKTVLDQFTRFNGKASDRTNNSSSCMNQSIESCYLESVPYIAVFPISPSGMFLQVWSDRDHPREPGSWKTDEKTAPGEIVSIPFGCMLLLRGDVVHGGGLGKDHPRVHMYIYREPNGQSHEEPTTNMYMWPLNQSKLTEKMELQLIYPHGDMSRFMAASNNVGDYDTDETVRTTQSTQEERTVVPDNGEQLLTGGSSNIPTLEALVNVLVMDNNDSSVNPTSTSPGGVQVVAGGVDFCANPACCCCGQEVNSNSGTLLSPQKSEGSSIVCPECVLSSHKLFGQIASNRGVIEEVTLVVNDGDKKPSAASAVELVDNVGNKDDFSVGTHDNRDVTVRESTQDDSPDLEDIAINTGIVAHKPNSDTIGVVSQVDGVKLDIYGEDMDCSSSSSTSKNIDNKIIPCIHSNVVNLYEGGCTPISNRKRPISFLLGQNPLNCPKIQFPIVLHVNKEEIPPSFWTQISENLFGLCKTNNVLLLIDDREDLDSRNDFRRRGLYLTLLQQEYERLYSRGNNLWINDSLLDFFLGWTATSYGGVLLPTQLYSIIKEQPKGTQLAYDTFFRPRRVRRNEIDIANTPFLLIRVNANDNHWLVVAVVEPGCVLKVDQPLFSVNNTGDSFVGTTVVVLDSLGCSNKDAYRRSLCRYGMVVKTWLLNERQRRLRQLFADQTSDGPDVSSDDQMVRCLVFDGPKQENSDDCGVYSCHNVWALCELLFSHKGGNKQYPIISVDEDGNSINQVKKLSDEPPKVGKLVGWNHPDRSVVEKWLSSRREFQYSPRDIKKLRKSMSLFLDRMASVTNWLKGNSSTGFSHSPAMTLPAPDTQLRHEHVTASSNPLSSGGVTELTKDIVASPNETPPLWYQEPKAITKKESYPRRIYIHKLNVTLPPTLLWRVRKAPVEPRKRRKPFVMQPTFPYRLYALLEKSLYTDVIDWLCTEDGFAGFQLFNRKSFIEDQIMQTGVRCDDFDKFMELTASWRFLFLQANGSEQLVGEGFYLQMDGYFKQGHYELLDELREKGWKPKK